MLRPATCPYITYNMKDKQTGCCLLATTVCSCTLTLHKAYKQARISCGNTPSLALHVYIYGILRAPIIAGVLRFGLLLASVPCIICDDGV